MRAIMIVSVAALVRERLVASVQGLAGSKAHGQSQTFSSQAERRVVPIGKQPKASGCHQEIYTCGSSTDMTFRRPLRTCVKARRWQFRWVTTHTIVATVGCPQRPDITLQPG
jgi:hypothetical protein